MITTKELLEWRDKMLAAYEEAVEKSENAASKEIEEYYSAVALVANNQLSLINRLIEQSRENDKEQGK